VGDYLTSLGNTIVDRSPDELIGAVMIALATSLAMAGLYMIGRRKLTDNLMPIIVLMIVGNLVSMALAAGYVVRARRLRRLPPHGAAAAILPWARPSASPEATLVETLFEVADKNHDGLLSADEASIGAAEFVHKADTGGKGSIDSDSLRTLLHGTLSQGRGPFRHPDMLDGPRPPPHGPPPPGHFGPALPETIVPRSAAQPQDTADPVGTSRSLNDPLPERKGRLE
jgi:hypothetical protein